MAEPVRAAAGVEATARGTQIDITDRTANPAPLGLLGFGLTTVLLNIHNAGYYELNTMILAMGIFYGGIAQIIAGIMEWKKNNTFGTTAFTSYGLFWLSLVGLILLPKLGLGEAASKPAMAAYFFVWGLFTFVMFLGTLKLNRALQFVFLSLTILFFLLTWTGDWAWGFFSKHPNEFVINGFAAAAALILSVAPRLTAQM